MRTGNDGAALRGLATLQTLGAVGHFTDDQLLERFATGTGEAAELAFEALVDRHGPMALRVCRAVLSDLNDVQDAFQATFLVSVRKAGTERAEEPVRVRADEGRVEGGGRGRRLHAPARRRPRPPLRGR